MSQQGLRQAAIRAVTGTALTYDGDWHALFTLRGVAAGPFNQRMIEYLQGELLSFEENLPNLMQEFAEANGAYNWSSMGTFTP